MDLLRKQPPFLQILLLATIGVVSAVLIGGFLFWLFGLFPSDDIAVQNMQNICLSAIPTGLGLFLVPGILYARITKLEKHNLTIKSIGWSFLLFIAGLGLLPILAFINHELIVLVGLDSQVEMLAQMDTYFNLLFGPEASMFSFVLSIVLIGLMTGICEEMAFRRLLFHHLHKNTGGLWFSVVVSGFIFALLHFNYIQLIPMTLFGILFALVFYITQSVWVSAALHALNNIISICVVRFGIDDSNYELYRLEIAIPSILLLTGLMYVKRNKLLTRNL